MTPETRRYPMVMAALEAGKHVFVEKPIAPTIEEAERAYALAAAKNLKLTIGYSRRFDPRYVYVKRRCKDGLIGEAGDLPGIAPFDAPARRKDHRPLENVADFDRR